MPSMPEFVSPFSTSSHGTKAGFEEVVRFQLIPQHATKESIHETKRVRSISCKLCVQKNKSNVEIRRPAAHPIA